MFFKHVLVTAGIVGMAIVGCSTESPTAVNTSGTSLESGKGQGSIAMLNPAQVTQIRVNYSPWCVTPKFNCFSTITVRPGNVTDISDLNDAILNDTQSSFFSTYSNWDSIWSSIPSVILTDLTNGDSKLVLCQSSTSTSKQWAAVDGSGNNVDYSGTP